MKYKNFLTIIISLSLFLLTIASALAETGEIEILVIGGGGSGGGAISAGGGAGGYQYNAAFTIEDAPYAVTVGAGGAGSTAQGNDGEDSVFHTITANGGGGGGYYTGSGSSGNYGGSGGGGAGGDSSAGIGGTGDQGGNGGNGHTGSSPWSSGGGGGAGGNGAAATSGNGGNGGVGIANSISGSSVYYAGGGGGGGYSATSAGTGGLGGGGDGSLTDNGQDGTDGLGGGGGGASNAKTGGAGGDGVVIISYLSSSATATGGTITTEGANTVHTFTSDGTFEVTSWDDVVISNFSTVETGNFNFDTPVSIGNSYGLVNTLTFNNTETADNPYYFASSLTTSGGTGLATCRITIDGLEQVTNTRSLSSGTYGNIALVSPATNLSLGSHTINTECQKTGGPNYIVNNSQLSTFLLYDSNSDSELSYFIFDNPTGYTVNSVDTLLDSFTFTTSNTTNTTNTPFLVSQGMINYEYDNNADITSYFKIIETGETCGPYTRGGSGGSIGSVGASCLFTDLNSSTEYNLSLYGYTSTGTGSLTNLASNLYEILMNDTAGNITTLSKTVPAATLTQIGTVSVSNLLGGDFNVFSEASIMVNSSTTQLAYFYLSDGTNTSNFYRTINNQSGNIVVQNVFSESGTGNKDVTAYAYCPSGCEIIGGDLNAFITDASTSTTGFFDVTAVNSWNSTAINSFNVTIGGTTYATTNGTVTALAQGTVDVIITAENFHSNTTSHDTTTDLNGELDKYVGVYVSNFGEGLITNFTANMTDYTYTTTNGLAYVPVVNDNTSVTVNGDTISSRTDELNITQYYTFNVYAENSLAIEFKDSETDALINNVNIDYFSSIDSNTSFTTNGTLYLTLLNPVTYTFRINSSGYVDNLYFTTITADSYEELTIYMNPNASTTAITIDIVDGGVSPVENAEVKALKYYVSDNTYRIVASGITNPDGQTVLDLITGDNFYKFVVVVDNEIVKTTSPFIITGNTLKIQVNLEEEILEDYYLWKDITTSLLFNKVSNNFRLDYTDTRDINREVCLSVYSEGFATRTLLDYTCVTGTSGTILTGVTNTSGSTYTAIATTTINSEEVVLGKETYKFPIENFGSSGLIGQVFLTLIMSLSGFIAIELLFIIAPISILIGGLVGLHTISLGVTIPLVIIGIIIMFILKRNQ